MRRLLRIPERPLDTKDKVAGAHRLFSISILLSALRCLLSYIFLPIVAPALGYASGDQPAIGIPVAVVALVFDARGIRRFWLVGHKWRWPITALYLVVMAMVTTLLVGNCVHLARS